MSYQGYSTRTNNNVNALTATVQANKTAADSDRALIRSELASEVSTLQIALQTEKTRAETAENALTTALNAEIARAQAKEGELETAIATEKSRAEAKETELETAIATEKARAEGVEADHETRIADIESWKATNIDELVGEEVDKAINSKVNQTAYDAVVAQLQSKDSELTQSISQSIADSDSKHEIHEDRINKSSANDVNMKAVLETVVDYLEKFSSTYVILDENENVVANPTWSDVKSKVAAVVAHTIVKYLTLNVNLGSHSFFRMNSQPDTQPSYIYMNVLGNKDINSSNDVQSVAKNGTVIDVSQWSAVGNGSSIQLAAGLSNVGDVFTVTTSDKSTDVVATEFSNYEISTISNLSAQIPFFNETFELVFVSSTNGQNDIQDFSEVVIKTDDGKYYFNSGLSNVLIVFKSTAGKVFVYNIPA